MRYRDILHDMPTSDTHPHTVALPLHPARWNEFATFVAKSPADFRLLSKLHPEPVGWFVFVGCASEAARKRLSETWG
jgi:hypothetical protein